jgi:hypothetical protein
VLQHGGKGIGERELSTNTRNISIKAGSRSVEKAKRIFLNSDGIESIRFDYYRPETLTPEQSLSSGLRIPDIPFGGCGPPSTILVGSFSPLHNDPVMGLPY